MKIKDIKAANLKRIRISLALKQRQIAEMLNIRESNISDMERGRRNITDKLIDRICPKLNIDPSEFFITPNNPLIIDNDEKEIIKNIRLHPEIKGQINTISKALSTQISNKEDKFRKDTAVQKKKRKTA